MGFAVQLWYLRFPGIILGADETPPPFLLRLVADQLKVSVDSWDAYGQREQTRREHLVELQTVYGFQSFTMRHYRQAAQWLTELAMQTDKGIVLVNALIERLRQQSIILPALNAVERVGAEAVTRANRNIHEALSEPLSNVHRQGTVCGADAQTTAQQSTEKLIMYVSGWSLSDGQDGQNGCL